MRSGSLFSGYLGLDRAVNAVFGSTTAWVSDIDPGACKIIAYRAPGVPNLGDITTVDWSQVEPVDIITGGSPCQDLSHAGKRGGMTEGTRSNLWVAMREAIASLRPSYVVWENVRGALSAEATSDVESREGLLGTGRPGPYLRAAGRVLGDLAELGYDSRMCGLRAADVGAPHGRFRIFVVATDARGEHGNERRAAAPRQAEGRRALSQPAGRRAWATADPDRERLQGIDERAARAGDAPRATGCCSGGLAHADAEGDQGRLRDGDGGAAPDAGGQRHGRGQDSAGVGRVDSEDADGARERQRTREVAGDRGDAVTADTDRAGSEARRGLPVGDRSLAERQRTLHRGNVDWGDYEPAIRRWEAILGRPAPAPTQPSDQYLAERRKRIARLDRRPVGMRGSLRPRHQLSPLFVEHMMGLPAGWVTDVPGLTRNAMLKALGNGVVSQQAEAALRYLLSQEIAA